MSLEGGLVGTDRLLRSMYSVSDLPRGVVALTIAAAMVAVGLLDVWSGAFLQLVLLYVVIVAFGAATLPLRSAVLVAVLTATSGMVASLATPEIPVGVAVVNAVFRVVFLAGVAFLVSMNRSALQHLDERSTTDPMTDCLNRRGLYGAAAACSAASRRSGATLAIAYFDLDGLKELNDRDGHAAGDRLIRGFADALHASCREVDVAARMGGDEFCLLMPATDAVGAESVVARLRDACDAHRPPLSASCGVVVWTDPPSDPDDLLRPADELMYRAKSARRGSHLVEVRRSATVS